MTGIDGEPFLDIARIDTQIADQDLPEARSNRAVCGAMERLKEPA